jgi:hypothetical protein
LRNLQKERDEVDRKSQLELRGASGERLQELQAQWSSEFFMVQEEINGLQSDYVREEAERLDVSIPKYEEGEFWERLFITGDRLILTTRGREESREKIRTEKKQIREAWGFYLQMAVTIGSLFVAALAIIFRR